MTVMVTGASGPLGHALIPRLVARDEVRAAVRRPETAGALRAMGAKVTVGRLDDTDALAEVLRRVFTVIHLVGGAHQIDDDAVIVANHASVLTALAAAREADVRRFILVSVPGASPDARDPYLRAKGLAEEAVAHSGLEYAVIRSTHLYGLGGFWFAAVVQAALAEPPLVLGDGGASLAPVYVDDLADVLVAADDRVEDPAGTWALEGPDAVTAAGLTRLLAAGPTREPVEVPVDEIAPVLERLLGIAVPHPATRLFSLSGRADAPDAAAAFGVTRTSLAEGLRITAERAAAANDGDYG
ncbi:MAG: NAD(P)H-binding protein [Actinomycetota bacterium]